MAIRDEYEILIPVRVRDETQAGARQVESSVEQMTRNVSQSSDRIANDSQRATKQQVDRNLAEWEREARGRLSTAQRAERERMSSIEREANAFTRSLAKQQDATDRSYAKMEDARRRAFQTSGTDPAESYFATIIRKSDEAATAVESGAKREVAAVEMAANAERAAYAKRGQTIPIGGTSGGATSMEAQLAAAERQAVEQRAASALFQTTRQRAAGSPLRAGDMEATFERDARAAAKLHAETEQAIADSAKAIRNAEQVAIGAEKAITSTTKAVEGATAASGSFGGQLASLVEGLGGTVAAVAAVVAIVAVLAAGTIAAGAAIVELTTHAAELGDEVYKASQKSNLGAETISVLRVAATEANVSFDSLSRGFARFENNLVKAASDSKSQVAEAFRAIGWEGNKLKEAIKNPDNAVREFIDTFNKLPRTAERDAIAIRLLGRDAYNLVPALAQMSGGFSEAENRARSMGVLFTDQAAKDAHDFEVKLRDLGLQAEGVGLQFGNVFMPLVSRALTAVSKFLSENKDQIVLWAGKLENAVEGTVRFVGVLWDFEKVLNPVHLSLSLIAQEVGGWGNLVSIIADVVAAISPIIQAINVVEQFHDWAFGVTTKPTSPASRAQIEGTAGGQTSNYARAEDEDLLFTNKDEERRKREAERAARAADTETQRRIHDLENKAQVVERQARDAMGDMERTYRNGRLAMSDFATSATVIENNRFRELLGIYGQERSEALKRNKGAEHAESDIDKKIEELRSNHKSAMLKITDDQEREQLELLKSRGDLTLQLMDDTGRRRAAIAQKRAEQGVISFENAETQEYQLERKAYARRDSYLESLQALYAKGTKQYEDYSRQRMELARKEADYVEAEDDRELAALAKQLAKLEEFDARMSQLDADANSRRADIGTRAIDIEASLGADPAYIRQRRQSLAQFEENESFKLEQARIRSEKEKALETATGDEIQQIRDAYNAQMELAEQQHGLRLYEIMVEPMVRYTQKVSELAGQVGDIFGTAFADIGQKGRSFWGDLTSGFNHMWQQIVHDFIASRVKQAIESLFNPTASATQQAGASSTGGLSIGNVLRGIFTPGVGGTTAPFNPSAGSGLGSVVQQFLGGGESAPGQSMLPVTAGTISALGGSGGIGSGGSSIFGPGGIVGALGAANPFTSASRFSLGGLGSSFAPLVPLLGLSLGTGLGKGSRVGSLLGGAGGLVGGALGGALLASLATNTGLFSTIFGGGTLSQFSFGLLGGPIGLGIAGAAAAALLIGSLLFGRNAQRRRDEQTRDQLSGDIRSKLYQLIQQVGSDQIDGQSALSQYAQMRADYVQQAQGLKDRKTRDHAMLWLTNDLEGQVLPKLYSAIEEQTKRRARAGRMHPEFAAGGTSYDDQVIKVQPGEGILYPWSRSIRTVPGVNRGYDSEYTYAPRGTRVITRTEMQRAAAFQNGGTVGDEAGAAALSGGIHIYPELHIDEEGLTKMIVRTRGFKNAVIHETRVIKKRGNG